MTTDQEPIPMLLWCPRCFEQHVDKPEPDMCKDCGHEHPVSICPSCPCTQFNAWLNDPHKKHRCQFCNHVWKPSEHPTTGVELPDLTYDAKPQSFANRKDFDDAVAIAAGRGGWVDVRERLPEKRKRVLVINRLEMPFIDFYDPSVKKAWRSREQVIAWMPIPPFEREGGKG